MSESVQFEMLSGLKCLLFGMGITLLYDLFLILRKVIKHSVFWINIEDFMYWIVTGVGLFLLMYTINYGRFRVYAIFFLGMGMLIYKKIIGQKIIIFMSTIINRILDIVVRILKVPLNLVKCGFLSAKKLVFKAFLRIKSALTSDIKKVKITLCKHIIKGKSGKKTGKDPLDCGNVMGEQNESQRL